MNSRPKKRVTKRNVWIEKRDKVILDEYFALYDNGFRSSFIKDSLAKKHYDKYGVTVATITTILNRHNKKLKSVKTNSKQVA